MHKLNKIYVKALPSWEEIPDIGLYLNQTVVLLEQYCANLSLNNDKIITNTMINNYVKQGIIPAPINKKYTRVHIGMLLVTCILKQVYSINDVQKLMSLAFENNTKESAYKKFSAALDLAITNIFKTKKINNSTNLTATQYILTNVTYSFATKLYVALNYLEKKDTEN